jgi:hypothetical protein
MTAQRMSILQLSDILGNVSEACRRTGTDRTSSHEWKKVLSGPWLDKGTGGPKFGLPRPMVSLSALNVPVPDERVVFHEKYFKTVDALQQNLVKWLRHYTRERPHQKCRSRENRPADTIRQSLKLLDMKMSSARKRFFVRNLLENCQKNDSEGFRYSLKSSES